MVIIIIIIIYALLLLFLQFLVSSFLHYLYHFCFFSPCLFLIYFLHLFVLFYSKNVFWYRYTDLDIVRWDPSTHTKKVLHSHTKVCKPSAFSIPFCYNFLVRLMKQTAIPAESQGANFGPRGTIGPRPRSPRRDRREERSRASRDGERDRSEKDKEEKRENRKRSRSRGRSRSPPRRRLRVVPRYNVQVPKILLHM